MDTQTLHRECMDSQPLIYILYKQLKKKYKAHLYSKICPQ